MNSLDDDGGKTPLFAPVKTNVKNDGGRNPRFAPVQYILGISAGTDAL